MTERASQAAARLVPFDSLPLGARFRYPGAREIWVKIENGDCGVVAAWDGIILDYLGQRICTFEESEESRARGMVELAEGELPAAHPDPLVQIEQHRSEIARLCRENGLDVRHFLADRPAAGTRYTPP